ncbi:MAG: protoporphyrinogen oxidase [Chloroflexi bacterium]|uniref:Coproporphyrinogen III oxidase n=1 Tax=Candidatus Chlorohelix allophototropha TaxID=3003348 RepID=A0A8T7LXM0_9CHLR|nr:protoporphyrinogen oxidase [Chloroflexota bacterium]WJW66075.1 protoporphyrinogen oxidase [Chloroflexota bacterium L227-S17]
MNRVVIIGGGITGLAAAWELQQQGIDYLLLEASNKLGGKIATERVDGFIIEGGADSFVTYKPAGVQLCLEMGLGDKIIGTSPTTKSTYIVRNGKLHDIPRGLRLIVPLDEQGLRESDVISEDAKARMLNEVNIPPRTEEGDETLASFVNRRFGEEALVVFADPMLGGIYTGDPDTMSMQATFPNYLQMEKKYGSLIAGHRNAPPPPPAKSDVPKSIFVSMRNGMGELIDEIRARLTGEILTGQRVIRIDSEGTVYTDTGEVYKASAVVATIPSIYLREMLHDSAPQLAQELRRIRTVSSATISMGFKESELARPLDSYGFVVAGDDPTPLRASTWSSTKFAGRAPEGYALLRVFVGGHRSPELVTRSDEELITLALAELKKLLGIEATPVISRVFRWINANPQYEVGHLDKVANIKATCPPWLVLAGADFEGGGIPDCIRTGRESAKQALASRLVSNL